MSEDESDSDSDSDSVSKIQSSSDDEVYFINDFSVTEVTDVRHVKKHAKHQSLLKLGTNVSDTSVLLRTDKI